MNLIMKTMVVFVLFIFGCNGGNVQNKEIVTEPNESKIQFFVFDVNGVDIAEYVQEQIYQNRKKRMKEKMKLMM